MKLFFWIIPCIFVLPQGVQAVVTHSLQAAMHSLGGIQVCNYNICFNTSDVMICWLKFSWNKILIWQHFHPVALRNFFCNLCSWWWSWKIFEVTETVWVPFILPRNSNIYETDALLPWNARLLESWITGKVACVFSFCQLSQNISDDIFIWSVSWSMKNRSLVGYLILFRVSLKYFIVRIMFLIELKVANIPIADAVPLVHAIGLPNIWTRSTRTESLVCFLRKSNFSLVTELRNSGNMFIWPMIGWHIWWVRLRLTIYFVWLHSSLSFKPAIFYPQSFDFCDE